MRHRRDVIRFMLLASAGAGLATAMPAPALALAKPPDAAPRASRQSPLHRSQTSGAVIGALRIPAIGIDEVVRSGVAIEVIDQGVAHWSGTALPGQKGNVVLAGHRTTFTRPFHDLDALNRGDLVYASGPDGADVLYSVTETMIVEPDDIWITYDRKKPMLTMFACHPKGSYRQRIVVTADLVGGRAIA